MPCDPQVSAPAGMSPGGGPLQKKTIGLAGGSKRL